MDRHCRGFTLLELMIVIVLISVLLSTVGLAIGQDSARQARQQAGDFIRLVQHLREQAVLEGQEYGLRVQPGAYQVLRLEGREWVTRTAVRRLPADLRLALDVDGHAIVLDDAPGSPQLLMLSSDEVSPFSLLIRAGETALAQVSSDGLSEPVLHD